VHSLAAAADYEDDDDERQWSWLFFRRDVNEATLLEAEAKAKNEAKIVCKNSSVFVLFDNHSQFRRSHSVITMIQL